MRGHIERPAARQLITVMSRGFSVSSADSGDSFKDGIQVGVLHRSPPKFAIGWFQFYE